MVTYPSFSACIFLFSLILTASAKTVPRRLGKYYSIVKSSDCLNPLPGQYFATDDPDDSRVYNYCYDIHNNLIYLKGPPNQLASMSVDCAGEKGGPSDDGRCGRRWNQSLPPTEFQALVRQETGQPDLNPFVHDYVVFGNVLRDTVVGGIRAFDPQEYGIQPLSVMAVVCNNQLFCGIWGDQDLYDARPTRPLVGQASISMATNCFGADNTGLGQGHNDSDVLYIAFRDPGAMPNLLTEVDWAAQDSASFRKSIDNRCNWLVSQVRYWPG